MVGPLSEPLQSVASAGLHKGLMACIDPPGWGHVAEWLRSGLQNRLLRFNSGRGLHHFLPRFIQKASGAEALKENGPKLSLRTT